MRTSPKLKKLLIRIIIAVILFLAKEHINLDNDLVNRLIIIIISTFLLDFNTFTLEITKVFFNGNNGEEGEGSNRQNNNTSNQDPSINPPSHEEAPEVERQTEGILEELIEDEEDRAFRDEDTRLIAQIKLREDVMFINQQDLVEKRTDIFKRLRDFEDLKNQSKSDESMIPVLADIKRKLDQDIEALNEYTNTIKDQARAYNAEIGKLIQDIEKAVAQREKSINESDSK
jgi:hypothetical protein